MGNPNSEEQVSAVLHSSVMKKRINNERRRLLIQRFLSNKLAVLGSVIMIIALFISIFAPLLAPYNPLEMNPVNRYGSPNMDHLLGADSYGRDILSRVVYGTRVSMLVGFSVTLISSLCGLIMGLYSAYYRKVDLVLMRVNDGLMAFPTILLAIAITAALGSSVRTIIISLSIVFTPYIARVVRSVALEIKEQTYIEALRSIGSKDQRIIWFHIAPNVVSPLIVQASFNFAFSIITEAGLSFLGAGVPAPNPSLGNILYEGQYVLHNAWWVTVFPGLTFIFLVLGLNMLGDGIRDFLDPHSK